MRPNRVVRFAVVVSVLVIVAGCAQPNAAKPAATVSSVGAPASFNDETGGIEGTMVDDALSPLEGVEVSLVPHGLQTSSAADGSFSFSYVPSGPVTVTGTKAEYDGDVRTAVVAAGQITQLQLVLRATGMEEAWHETIQVQGFVCLQGWALTSISLSGACPGQGLVFVPFNVQQDLASIVAEMTWQRASAITSNEFQLAIWQGGSRSGTLNCEHCYGEKKGGSPLQLRIDEGDGTAFVGANGANSSEAIRLDNYISTRSSENTTGGVNIAYQQRVSILDSVFYHQRAPLGFSALPDD